MAICSGPVGSRRGISTLRFLPRFLENIVWCGALWCSPIRWSSESTKPCVCRWLRPNRSPGDDLIIKPEGQRSRLDQALVVLRPVDNFSVRVLLTLAHGIRTRWALTFATILPTAISTANRFLTATPCAADARDGAECGGGDWFGGSCGDSVNAGGVGCRNAVTTQAPPTALC